MSPTRKRAQRGALVALLITTALAAAACGGSSGSASTPSTTAASTTATTSGTAGAAATGVSSAALAKYTACLKQQGVTLPTGGAPPGGGTGAPGGAPPTGTTGGGTSTTARPARSAQSAAFTKAMTACASLRPAGMQAGPGGGFRGGTANTAAFAAYRNCLTLHGVKATAQIGPGGATLTASEKKAVSACASLRPTRQTSTSTTSTSGNS